MPIVSIGPRGQKQMSVPAPGEVPVRVERAFLEDVKRLYNPGKAMAARIVGTLWADDCVQQALIALWELCYSGGEGAARSVDKLFWRILRRRISDMNRRMARETERDESQLEAVEARIESRTNTAMVADGSLLAARVDYIVSTFPPKMRQAVLAAQAHDWNERAAADAMGISYDLVKWHVREGRRRLREQLEKDGYDVPAALRIGRPARGNT